MYGCEYWRLWKGDEQKILLELKFLISELQIRFRFCSRMIKIKKPKLFFIFIIIC